MKNDSHFMADALAEAKKATGWTSPNPLVGAVIVKNGKVIARGHHQKAGEAHAEVMALAELNHVARGCTLYTTLEPCTHVGRTPPCTKAIIKAGINRVVIGTIDPNPRVRRRGLRALRRAGIEVHLNVLEEDCRALNKAYNFAIVHQRPWVLMKAATSLDGRIATRTGQSQWITSKAARARGRMFRGELDAICVGISTVLADDPLLTTRIRGQRDPVRVILDSELRTPLKAKLVRTADRVKTIIATTRKASLKKRNRLQEAGVEIVTVKQARGRVHLPQLMEKLYAKDIHSLIVEGGAATHGSFVDAGLVDCVAMFLAPTIIGGKGAPCGVAGRGAGRLQDALHLGTPRIEHFGPDILILADVRRE